jgi:hypothetical protein
MISVATLRLAMPVASTGNRRTESIPAPTSEAPASAPIAPFVDADPGDRDDQRQARRGAEGEAQRLPSPELAEPEQGRGPTDGEEEHEEERREREVARREQAVEVEVHPRDYRCR